jgi:hypothetical protein
MASRHHVYFFVTRLAVATQAANIAARLGPRPKWPDGRNDYPEGTL